MDDKIKELEANVEHFASIIATISHKQEIMNFALQSICFSLPAEQKHKLSQAIQEQRDVIQNIPLKSNESPSRKADLLDALTNLEMILAGAKVKLALH